MLVTDEQHATLGVEREPTHCLPLDRLQPGGELAEVPQPVGVRDRRVRGRRRGEDEERVSIRVRRSWGPSSGRSAVEAPGRPPSRRTRSRPARCLLAVRRSSRAALPSKSPATQVARARGRTVRGVGDADAGARAARTAPEGSSGGGEPGVVWSRRRSRCAGSRSARSPRPRTRPGVDPAEDACQPRRQHVGHGARGRGRIRCACHAAYSVARAASRWPCTPTSSGGAARDGVQPTPASAAGAHSTSCRCASCGLRLGPRTSRRSSNLPRRCSPARVSRLPRRGRSRTKLTRSSPCPP